jgi:hypothetical protein
MLGDTVEAWCHPFSCTWTCSGDNIPSSIKFTHFHFHHPSPRSRTVCLVQHPFPCPSLSSFYCLLLWLTPRGVQTHTRMHARTDHVWKQIKNLPLLCYVLILATRLITIRNLQFKCRNNWKFEVLWNVTVYINKKRATHLILLRPHVI